MGPGKSKIHWVENRLETAVRTNAAGLKLNFFLKVKVKVKSLSHVRLFATPWTVTYQATPSKGFSRQEYWSGVPLPSPGDLPDSGIKPRTPALNAKSLPSEPPGKPQLMHRNIIKDEQSASEESLGK